MCHICQRPVGHDRGMRQWLQARGKLTWIAVGVSVFAVPLLTVNALIADHETAPASSKGPGFVVHVPDGDLHVRVDGPSGAPALVLLHGLANSSRSWDRLAPLLANRFRVVRIDLLGHGQSAKPGSGYQPQREAAGLRETIRRLKLCQPVLVGHSLGGIQGAATIAADPKLFSAAVMVDVPPRKGYAHLPFMAQVRRCRSSAR